MTQPTAAEDPPDLGLPESGPGSLATVGHRAVARLIDVALISIPFTIVAVIFFSTTDDELTIETPIWLIASFFALDFVYEVTLVHLRGQTVGKMIMGIRIVRLSDHAHPDWHESGIRFLLPGIADAIPVWFSGVLSAGVYLTAVFDPNLRGIHDKAGGTIVVRSR